SLGTLGVVQPDPEQVGLKLLRPDVLGSSCRSSVVGVPLSAGDPDVSEALAAILRLDAEGNRVANVRLSCRSPVTGLHNRRAIEVRGDLARTVSTIRLLAPEAHGAHRRPV